MWSPKAITEMVRELVLLGVGAGGILYQQVHGVNVPLLVVFTAMTGVPGGAALWRLVARTALDPGAQPPPTPPGPPSDSPPPPGHAGGSGP